MLPFFTEGIWIWIYIFNNEKNIQNTFSLSEMAYKMFSHVFLKMIMHVYRHIMLYSYKNCTFYRMIRVWMICFWTDLGVFRLSICGFAVSCCAVSLFGFVSRGVFCQPVLLLLPKASVLDYYGSPLVPLRKIFFLVAAR